MPFNKPLKSHKFTEKSVSKLSSSIRGVYGLYREKAQGKKKRWIYIGQGYIRDRLEDHLRGENLCIEKEIEKKGVYWVYEVVKGGKKERRRREKKLIDYYEPLCNSA